MAVAIPLSFLAQRQGIPQLFELGERAGAVLASHFGGTPGQVAFQGLDAALERVLPAVTLGGPAGIGRIGQVYG